MFKILFFAVLTLLCYIGIGFVLRKTKLASEDFAKSFSVYTIYVGQIAMLLHCFIIPFDKIIFKKVSVVFILSFFIHLLMYFVAIRLFKKAPEKTRAVLQFGIIFCNVGFMGIPLVIDVFGDEFVIYVTANIIWFNVLGFSLGRLIFTNDKKYISLKKIIVNPAVIPIMIGFIIYLTGFGGYITEKINDTDFFAKILKLIYDVVTILKNTVAPASMIVVGAKLAQTSFKGLHKDKNVYLFTVIRLFLFPFMIWAILRVLYQFNVIDYNLMAVMLIVFSTPAATTTTIFAELYEKDSEYAGKLVALTSLLSVVTMPIVSLLLYI